MARPAHEIVMPKRLVGFHVPGLHEFPVGLFERPHGTLVVGHFDGGSIGCEDRNEQQEGKGSVHGSPLGGPYRHTLASRRLREAITLRPWDRAEHCWNGDHTRANAYSRLRYPQMVLPWVVERILDTAPQGADVDSWRY
jgi:hypothetical protein